MPLYINNLEINWELHFNFTMQFSDDIEPQLNTGNFNVIIGRWLSTQTEDSQAKQHREEHELLQKKLASFLKFSCAPERASVVRLSGFL